MLNRTAYSISLVVSHGAFINRKYPANPGSALFYFEPHQRSVWTLLKGGPWVVDMVDAWNMTITPVDGEQPGEASIPLPGKTFHALRVRKAEGVPLPS